MNLIRTWLQKLQNENFQRINVKYGKRGTKSCQTAALDIYILIGERRFKSMEMQNVIAQLSVSEILQLHLRGFLLKMRILRR